MQVDAGIDGRLAEIGVDQADLAEVGIGENGAGGIGPPQAGPAQIAARATGVPEGIGAGKVAILEIGQRPGDAGAAVEAIRGCRFGLAVMPAMVAVPLAVPFLARPLALVAAARAAGGGGGFPIALAALAATAAPRVLILTGCALPAIALSGGPISPGGRIGAPVPAAGAVARLLTVVLAATSVALAFGLRFLAVRQRLGVLAQKRHAHQGAQRPAS